MNSPDSLTDLLARLHPEDETGEITLGEILRRIGEGSYAPLVLVPALLLVSPLSAIPGMPTLGALLIVTLCLQWVVARRHPWLPGFLLRRQVPKRRLTRALAFLERPAAWLDRRSRARLTFLVHPPLSLGAKVCICVIALTWPLLELLPMVTSVGATAVSLFAFGLMMRDGLFVALGFIAVGVVSALVYALGTAV